MYNVSFFSGCFQVYYLLLMISRLIWYIPKQYLSFVLTLDFIVIFNKHYIFIFISVSSDQSLSHVWLFATPLQASLSITNYRSLLKLMSIELVMASNISSSVVPFSSCLKYFPASGSFPRNQFFVSGGQSIGASASVLPMIIQDWFPLGWTGWISLQSKGLSRVFSNTTVQKHQFFSTQLSL